MSRKTFGKVTGLTPFPKSASRLEQSVVAWVLLFRIPTHLTPFPKWDSLMDYFVVSWVDPFSGMHTSLTTFWKSVSVVDLHVVASV